MATQHPSMPKGNSHATSSSVPGQLASPTDLTEQEVQEVSAALNSLIADAFALYVKIKNFHWHLSGSHFRDYHLLFDKHAEQVFASIDVLAERVRRIGGITIHSISQISQLQTIQDDNDMFVVAGEMLHRLMEDNTHIAQLQRAACELCEKNRDFASASALEAIIDETERRKWFLFEAYQGLSNAN